MKKLFVSLFASSVLVLIFNTDGQTGTADAGDNTANQQDDSEENLDETFNEIDQRIEKSLERLLRRTGMIDEEIEQYKKDLAEKRANLPPENVRVGQGIQKIERLMPEVEGLSSTWESVDPPILVCNLTVALAEYHKLPEATLQKLAANLDQYVHVGSKHVPEILNSVTNDYVRRLVLDYERLIDDLTALENDRKTVSKVRQELLSIEPDTNTRKLDKFVSCVQETRDKADREFIKYFSSLTSALDKTVKSIDKSQRIKDDLSRELSIGRAVSKTLGYGPYSSIGRTYLRILKRDCYARFDIESLQEDFRELKQDNAKDEE
ncbi:MAG: hypothetical protein F4Z01_07885 [Gammaproteobacteria bacterium]|nr:hypothetical protein [Gammaproteobacteria bacterium]